MTALDAAIKREVRGEAVRWQAEPRVKRSLSSRLLGVLGTKPPPLARPLYMLTDQRLLALDRRAAEVVVREVSLERARDLMSRWNSLTEHERASFEGRLLQEIQLLCPTEAVNGLKRTLARVPR